MSLKILFSPVLSNSFPVRGYQIFSRLAKNHEVYLLHSESYMETLNEIGDVKLRKIPVSLPFTAGDKHTPRSRLSFYSLNVVSYLRKITQILKHYDLDIIVYSDLVVGPVINYMAKRLGTKTVFDCADFMPAFISNYLSNNYLINRISETASLLINGYLDANSDLVVAVGTVLAKKIGEKNKDVIVIPNGADSRKFHPNVSGKAFRARNNLPDDSFVFMFIGSLGFWLNLDMALRAFNIVHQKHCNTSFAIVGPDAGYLTKTFKRITTTGIHFLGRIPYRQVPEAIAAADVCVLPYKPSLATHAGIPVTMQEYTASGKPVVSTPLIDIKQFYGDAVLYANSVNRFRKAFEEYLEDDELRKINGRKGFEIFNKHFDLDKLADMYEDELTRLSRQKLLRNRLHS